MAEKVMCVDTDTEKEGEGMNCLDEQRPTPPNTTTGTNTNATGHAPTISARFVIGKPRQEYPALCSEDNRRVLAKRREALEHLPAVPAVHTAQVTVNNPAPSSDGLGLSVEDVRNLQERAVADVVYADIVYSRNMAITVEPAGLIFRGWRPHFAPLF